MIKPLILIEESKGEIKKKLGQIAKQMYKLDSANKGARKKNHVYKSLQQKYCSLFARLHCKRKIL